MTVQTTNMGFGQVIVWVGIIGDHKTELVRVDGRLTGERYARDILTPYVLPICSNGNIILMHDKAPSHTAKTTNHFLEQWPAFSPDMNPV